MTIPMYEISFCLTFATAFYACVQNVVSKSNEPKAAFPCLDEAGIVLSLRFVWV